MRVSGARRAGRSHRRSDVPCQDAFAVHRDALAGGRAAAAVADGLGSRPLSHFGSQAACDAAVASLAGEPEWDRPALERAFKAARAAVQAVAAERGLEPDELATTLQVATFAGGRATAAMVGDGAIVAVGSEGGPTVLLPPREAEYANVVVPITHASWREDFRYAEREGVEAVLLFSDGLTRLLLARSRDGWRPFDPFFEAFLPQLRAAAFDEAVVQKFLASDAVDRSWDDDKVLVALAQHRVEVPDARAA